MLAISVVLVVVAAAIAGNRVFSHGAKAGAGLGTTSVRDAGTGPAAVPGVFGIPTVTSGCPAASVRSARARCPQAPECWKGMTVSSGSASARSLPCTRPHVWQTFAIAILPADARTFDQNIVEANPTVRAVCSMRVLLRSRQGRARRIPASSWEADALPPDEAAYDGGARAYRCVAHQVSGAEPSTSEFGR